MAGQEVPITQISQGKLILEAMPTTKVSPMLAWLAENGPIADFPGDPGDEGLLPLDDIDL